MRTLLDIGKFVLVLGIIGCFIPILCMGIFIECVMDWASLVKTTWQESRKLTISEP